jgi:hypothetical protein
MSEADPRVTARGERQANARYHDDYERRVAKDIVMMLLETRVDAQRVLAFVDAMLHVKPPGEDPHDAPALRSRLGDQMGIFPV